MTPAAGFIQPWGAFVLGVAATVVCYGCCELRKMLHFDDALDVWGVHGMGGFLGTVLLGALADGSECFPEGLGEVEGVTAPGYCVNPGTITRSGEQFGKQLLAGILTASYSLVVTVALLKGIDVFVPILPQAKGLKRGDSLDLHEHGEQAYSPQKAYVPEGVVALPRQADEVTPVQTV